MKKLNNKGFTLIELLAVIVVLAIVMVIAVTSVLNSTRNAAVNSFYSSAQSVADFVKQQEQLYSLGTGNAEPCYTEWRNRLLPSDIEGGTTDINLTDAGTCFGLNSTDYNLDTSLIDFDDFYNNSGNSIKVTLCASSDGKFANIASNNDIEVTEISHYKCVTAIK